MSKVRGFEVVKGYEDKDIHLPIRKTAYSAAYDLLMTILLSHIIQLFYYLEYKMYLREWKIIEMIYFMMILL